jgi:hypothetical protein
VSSPDEIIAQRLAAGLDVTGEVPPEITGGDPAGANAPSVPFDMTGATAAAADIDALRARLADLEAAQAAAAPPAPEPEPEPADLTPVLSSSVASDVREAFQRIHERIAAIESRLGL